MDTYDRGQCILDFFVGCQFLLTLWAIHIIARPKIEAFKAWLKKPKHEKSYCGQGGCYICGGIAPQPLPKAWVRK